MNASGTAHIMDSNPITGPPIRRQEFAELAREHHRCLLVYARALAGNHATAADLVQDAFVSAWRNLGRFDVTRDFGAWLRGIIRNKWRETIRRQNREVAVDEATLNAWETDFANWDASSQNNGSNLMDALDDCLRRLPAAMGDAVRRFYYQDESGDALAASLGIDFTTLRKRLQRARQSLRDCLNRKLQPHS